MSKGLEALKEHIINLKSLGFTRCEEWLDLIVIEKDLKAFEIIRNRIIDMHDFLVYDTYSSFNQRRTLKGLTPISKEEYDLLKEILNNDD